MNQLRYTFLDLENVHSSFVHNTICFLHATSFNQGRCKRQLTFNAIYFDKCIITASNKDNAKNEHNAFTLY